jgi:hypothetical protein
MVWAWRLMGKDEGLVAVVYCMMALGSGTAGSTLLLQNIHQQCKVWQ